MNIITIPNNQTVDPTLCNNY